MKFIPSVAKRTVPVQNKQKKRKASMIASETWENIKSHNKKAYAVDDVYLVVDSVLSKKINNLMRNLTHLLAFIHFIYKAYSQTFVEEDKINIWVGSVSKLDLSVSDRLYNMQLNLNLGKLEYRYYVHNISMICSSSLEYWWLLGVWIFILRSLFVCHMLQVYILKKN